jgi:hypothetical protein
MDRSVDRAVPPTATSRHSAIEPLVTMSERGKDDGTMLSSHSEDNNLKRHRGRRRISPIDKTQTEVSVLNNSKRNTDTDRWQRRRTQIRLAQCRCKLRQETTIQLLQNKLSNIKDVISQASKAFHNF